VGGSLAHFSSIDRAHMRVSVVTISYNQARYIEETILSVIQQDYANLEYIVVDAGSTDNSRDIIEKYNDRIDKIIFEPDVGPADGLNKGFRAATGEIFGFVNADDKLLPGAVSRVVSAFGQERFPDVVYGNGYKIDSEGGIVKEIHSDPFNVRRYAYGCVTFIQPSVFVRRDAFFAVGAFNPLNRTCWDGELLFNLALAKKSFVLLDEFLSCFRVHSSSISGTGSLNYLYEKDRERFFRKAVGRDRLWYDVLLKRAFRIEKWTLNPAGLVSNLLFVARNLISSQRGRG